MKAFLVQAIPPQAPLDGLYDRIAPISPTGGGGAFSAVFEATHIAKACKVALKFFAGQNDPYRQDAFTREGVLLNSVLKNEPLFVQLVEPPRTFDFQIPLPGGAGTLPLQLPYLAFEWLPDGTLEQHCTPTQGYLDLLGRLELFKEACRSVARLHFLGCAHRDLKPGNFFVRDRVSVKLGDFGTSRVIATGVAPLRTFYAAPPGDFRYTALEAIAGICPDDLSVLRRGDAYSLGAILFELVTGQKLYARSFGPLQTLRAFMQHMRSIPDANRRDAFHLYLNTTPRPLPDLRAVNPHIPRCVASHLATAFERLAHYDYRQRIDNISEIHRVLRICELVLKNEAKARRIICQDPTKRRADSYV